MRPLLVALMATALAHAVSLARLRVDNRDAPLGIDTTPRFSWNIVSTDAGSAQTSYRVLVSTASAGQNDQWDSGVVQSSVPYGVLYAGKAFQPDTVYHWQVTVNTTSLGSATSSSTFTTGLLQASDWQPSTWISKAFPPSLNISQSSWIWTSEGGSAGAPAGDRAFRKSFSSPSGKSAISADVILTVDDQFTFFINGAQVGASNNSTDAWRSAARYAISKLDPKSNIFALRATNTAGNNSPAGVLVAIQINFDDGSWAVVRSDATWLTITGAPPAGFEKSDFDDSKWAKASVYGTYGVAPWNSDVTVPGPSSANPDFSKATWIWTNEMSSGTAPAADRPFRKVFTTPSGRTAISADIVLTVDDLFTLYVNGVSIGSSPNDTDVWKQAQQFINVTLSPSSNVFAVRATNRPDPNSGGPSPAGLLAAIFINYADGTRETVFSDSAWLTLASTPPTGFEQPNFSTSGWSAASTLGAYGANPWGSQVNLAQPLVEHPAPLLRKEFTPSKSVSYARLYYTAGGYAQITLNGKPISDHVLTPGFTTYTVEVQSVAIDVHSLLVSGKNVLGAELGRSHYGVTQGNVWNWNHAPWTAEPTLRIMLSIGYFDGSKEKVVTDSSWTWADGPTRLDDVFGGENIDARRRRDGYDTPLFDGSSWTAVQVVSGPAGKITNQYQPPTRIIESLSPISITSPKSGIYVATFARNVVGWVKLSTTGPAGTLVTVHYGEKLHPDGTVFYEDFQHYYANNFQTDRFWLTGSGSPEVFEAKFSYKGYQYIQIDGATAQPAVADIVGRVVYDDLEQRGDFRCSVELLNTLHKASKATMLHNSHSYPQDCPTYEKNGWSGDAMLSAEGFLSNHDSHGLLTQYVKSLADSRLGGGPPGVIAPDDGWGANNHASPWHSAFILIPHWLNLYRGDLITAQTHYDSMKDYIQFEVNRSPGWLSHTDLGDWVTPETSPLGGNPPENSTVPGTAYLYIMLKTMEELATVLGKTADASTFSNQAANVKTAFNNAFYNSGVGHYTAIGDQGYRQTHNLLALAFGLTNNGTEQRVADSIANDVATRGTHLNTGALGTKYILPVLTQWGHADVAFKLATQTTFPSWGFWFENGATSMWEHWAVDARSHQHHFLGTFEDWFYQYVLGIQGTSAGFKTVRIAPSLITQIPSASGWLLTPYGNLTTSYNLDFSSGLLTLVVSVPPGVTATITFAAGSSAKATAEGGLTVNGKVVKSAQVKGDTVEVVIEGGEYTFEIWLN